jgi:hypothetical protein
MSASNSRSNAGLSQVGGYPRRRPNQQYVLSILPSQHNLETDYHVEAPVWVCCFQICLAEGSATALLALIGRIPWLIYVHNILD